MVKHLNENAQFNTNEFLLDCAEIEAKLEGILNDDNYDYVDDLSPEVADALADRLQSIIKLCGEIADSFNLDLLF